MRTKYQMQVRQARVNNANALLTWLEKNWGLSGKKVMEEIIDPFFEDTGLERFEVWRAWGILKKTGRCTDRSGWKWELLSKEPVMMLEDGSVK